LSQGTHAAPKAGQSRSPICRPRWRQGFAEGVITPGDAVLIHTGWRSLMKDNVQYGGEPGIGVEAAKWLAAKQVALIGADTCEVGPNSDAELAFPVHQELITKNGIFLQENPDLSALVTDQTWEFLYVFAPVGSKRTTALAPNSLSQTRSFSST
jgi:kynurenine formamidase